METFYYIAYSINKKDNTTARLTSMHFDNEQDARELYEAKKSKPNVLHANLYRVEDRNGTNFVTLLEHYVRF